MSMAWTERVNEQSENRVIDDIYSYMEGTADSASVFVFKRADDTMYKRKDQLRSMGADARV